MSDPNLRVDAERNRARIVAAARRIFAERGLNASLEDIASQAGVGVGTLYRRFPRREDLIGAPFQEKMTVYADAVEAALADPDPWRGFCGYVELIERAKATGAPRADFGPEDLVMLLMANAGVLSATRDAAPNTWKRFVAYMIHAFSADDARPLPDAPTPRRMYRAMLRMSAARRT